VSYSVRAVSKATISAALVLALCLALILVVAGCGDKSPTTTTLRTGTTQAGGTSTTIGGVSADATALVGKWYCERIKETIEFTSDGEMIWTKSGKQPFTFPFTVQAGVIVFTLPNAPVSSSLPFTLSGGTLSTMDPKYGRLTYTKQ
jgi:hypothetical protein